ncbi:hypothetical protein RCH09_002957 [Actimicrobium sp. GrIS 1.19]|uniref:hypothetical protein n=1 Tax=Actimicrobium sp. GrIS 1.19 TaxID=3071708 RepID=UPI002E0213ED|nr:hypothetical protein [Actimicrobium sp. GrIS 1.19]
MKLSSLLVAGVAATLLGGCAVYGPPPPAYGYGGGGYYGPHPVYVQPAPVYIEPPVTIGFGFWGRRGWGGHHH